MCVCVHSCLTKSLPFSRCVLRGRHEIIHQLCHLFLEKHHYVLLSMRRDSLKNLLEKIISRQTQLILKFMMRFHRVQRAQFIIFFTKLMNCDARGRRERDDVERRNATKKTKKNSIWQVHRHFFFFRVLSNNNKKIINLRECTWVRSNNAPLCLTSPNKVIWFQQMMCHRCLIFFLKFH